MERWEQRLRAPTVSFPVWSSRSPDTLIFLSNESGSQQLWVVDHGDGSRRQLTHHSWGVSEFLVHPEAAQVAWWRDDEGSELGSYVLTKVTDGTTTPLIPGIASGWNQGVALADGRAVVAVSREDQYSVWVCDALTAHPRLLLHAAYPLGLGRPWETTPGGLSSDARLVCVRHAEFGDMLHFGLRAYDAVTGDVVAELHDQGRTLAVGPWSPLPGDQRVAVIHERDGVERPQIWHPKRQHVEEYPLDLPGPVDVLSWWPDARSLLLTHHWRGRDTLHRLDLGTGSLTWRHDPQGAITGAAVRPDGQVWLRSESATTAPAVHVADGPVVLMAQGDPPPTGAPHESFVVSTPGGEAHLLLAHPVGEPPWPTVLVVHGGPEWHFSDDLDPWEQALVDHGLAVAKVNYRGSTGSSVAWRTAIHENIGFPEVGDVMSGVDFLVERGLADPTRLGIEGRSWGGYVTLLAIGLHPQTFRAAVAVVPVADSVLCHQDCSPPQQAYDIAIMGGTPQQLPDRYAERSPITYVDQVRSPLLVIAGEFDSACPIRQVRHYVDRLTARGADVTLEVYGGGHDASTTELEVAHTRRALQFLTGHLMDGDPPPR